MPHDFFIMYVLDTSGFLLDYDCPWGQELFNWGEGYKTGAHSPAEMRILGGCLLFRVCSYLGKPMVVAHLIGTKHLSKKRLLL